VPEEELRAKLTTGEVTSTDLVWRDGMGDWTAVSAVPELASLVRQVPAVPATTAMQGSASPYQPPLAGSSNTIPNYLWQSIVVTIFCCWPFGIPAIINAAKVDSMKSRGDLQGAMEASAKAKKWCVISVASWVVVIILYAIFAAIGVASSQ
jgi:hypothetical protein